MRPLAVLFFVVQILSLPLHAENVCPQKITVSIRCKPTQRNFQFLSHKGNYLNSKMEVDQKTDHIICSYRGDKWVSEYKYIDHQKEKIIRASSLLELWNVVQLIHQIGFNVDYFSADSKPFTMVTFKPSKHPIPDQMFLFSGLESTFDEDDNFLVNAFDKKRFSTIILNERYLKSQNATADTFQTGSNCSIMIK